MLEQFMEMLQALSIGKIWMLFLFIMFMDYGSGIFRAWKEGKPLRSSITREKMAAKFDSYKYYIFIAAIGQFINLADISRTVLLIPILIEITSLFENIKKSIGRKK
jgi:phage-related holin